MGYSPWASQRIGHNLAMNTHTTLIHGLNLYKIEAHWNFFSSLNPDFKVHTLKKKGIKSTIGRSRKAWGRGSDERLPTTRNKFWFYLKCRVGGWGSHWRVFDKGRIWDFCTIYSFTSFLSLGNVFFSEACLDHWWEHSCPQSLYEVFFFHQDLPLTDTMLNIFLFNLSFLN